MKKDKQQQNNVETSIEGSKNLSSAVKLFENTSIFKSLSKVVFLAVVVSLATGIYVFADQVLMVRVLPLNTTYYSPEQVFGSNYDLIVSTIDNYGLSGYINTSVASVIRTSISLSSPLTVIGTAITLLLGLGISINYSKMLGRKDYLRAQNAWTNGFYFTLFFSIITSAIMIGITNPVVELQYNDTSVQEVVNEYNVIENANLTLSQTDIDLINGFFDTSKSTAISWANEYSYIISGFNIFNCFTMVFISLLNSEGKNGIPTIFILIANILNMGLDTVLLLYTDLGISGAAYATVISWFVSTSIFVIYIYYLNRKNDTLLLYRYLKIKEFRLDKTILWMILAIGVSSFFRNAATAVFSLTQQSIYGNITTTVTGKQNSYYLTILGAVNPIFNLFYSAIIGVIRGARTVITYNHGKNNIANVKKSFLISIGMSVTYSLIFFLISAVILPEQFLWIFDILPSDANYADSNLMLLVIMGQLPIFGLSVSGLLYFQSTDKPITSLITSIMYGIIIGVPGLLIAQQLSLDTKDINYCVYAPLVIMTIAGVLVFSYSCWYLFVKKPKPKFKTLNLNKK